MSDTMKRIGLWTLGRLLPKEDALEYHIRHLARSVMYMVTGGMIVASLFFLALFGCYRLLVEQGIPSITAIGLVGILAIIGATICFFMAEKSLSRASKLHHKLGAAVPKLPTLELDVNLQAGFSTLIGSFMEGFKGRGPVAESENLKSDIEHKIEALKREIELIQETELDDSLDENGDIIRFRRR